AAAYILGEIGQQNMQQQVFEFLSDKDPQVRREAVKAATKMHTEAVIPKLFFMLLDKSVGLDAAKALASMGDRIIEPARSILDNSLENFELKVAVAKMLGDISSREVILMLMDNLSNKSAELRNALLESLKRIMTRTEYNVLLDQAILRRYLFKEFYLYFQMLYYKDKIRDKTSLAYLADVIDTKLISCVQRIFSLLSIMYGQKLFDSIFFNISQKNVSKEQRSSAVELIDNIVDKDIRRILVPLIEATDEKEKLEQGFAAFKIKMPDYHDILEIFLTDDNDWVRAVTLHLIATEGISEMGDKVNIFMYDPSPLVRETALCTALKLKVQVADEDIYFLLSDSSKNVSGYAAWYMATARRKFETGEQYAYNG
ncbi:MAG TPA: HEAT repeat domain-containing protein, partial [bacterium]|nr:HEAT repeat domain-containing protein [bacterium]